jgi:RNA methyltransferase, TrmH family
VRLAQDGRFRRAEGRALIEGPHLVQAALDAGITPEATLVSAAGAGRSEIERLAMRARRQILLADKVFRSIVDAETPQAIAAEISIPRTVSRPDRSSVFLEGIQDAGNVGAIIRSAAAFGIGTVYLDRACADAWSPKVLRAGAGGHFAVAIVTWADVPDAPLVCAMAHGGEALAKAKLGPSACWVFGAEGRGVSAGLEARAEMKVTIPLAPGTESLNVAAAAAICFYEAFSRRARGS